MEREGERREKNPLERLVTNKGGRGSPLSGDQLRTQRLFMTGILIILGRNAFVISFNNALNIVSGFWRFLAPFINIAKGVAINSFISDDTGISFVEIVKP